MPLYLLIDFRPNFRKPMLVNWEHEAANEHDACVFFAAALHAYCGVRIKPDDVAPFVVMDDQFLEELEHNERANTTSIND